LADCQHITGKYLNALGDAPSVQRFGCNGFQYEQIQRTLEQI
jgi:hypothetical protein